jgi:hypothetical protein
VCVLIWLLVVGSKKSDNRQNFFLIPSKVIVYMACWKIPELNGGFIVYSWENLIYKCWSLSYHVWLPDKLDGWWWMMRKHMGLNMGNNGHVMNRFWGAQFPDVTVSWLRLVNRAANPYPKIGFDWTKEQVFFTENWTQRRAVFSTQDGEMVGQTACKAWSLLRDSTLE